MERVDVREHGIIKQAMSDWAAPTVIVKKKDDTIRLCVDYRRLNAVSRVDPHPMPRIDELIDMLGQAVHISTLDLTKWYWQVPVVETDQPKTAFTTPFGLFQFRRTSFGLQGAPATFQRMMDIILEGLSEYASAYLDDLIIFSKTWGEHLQHLDTVFMCLGVAGLTAKPAKCQFAMQECVYMGHIVGEG